jgi:hypothetical protein
VLWVLGFFLALLLVLVTVIRAFVLRHRTGDFPKDTWRWCGIAIGTWLGIFGLGLVVANMLH